MLVAAALTVCTAWGPRTAGADGSVTITLTADGQRFADDIGLDVQELERQLTDELQSAFDILRLPNFLQAFSDAASFSNRGIGVDYAANTKGLIVGVAGAVGVGVSDSIENEAADQPAAGVAPNISIMLGMNMQKLLEQPQLTLFVNGFHRKGSYEQLDASITSVGAHAQYKLLRNRDRTNANLVFLWGGIDLTGGLEYSRLGLSLSDTLETEMGVEGDQGQALVTMRSQGRYDMTASALTVPLEVTTNVRVLYLVSLYGGAGFDLQLGGSDLEANLDGTLIGNDPQDGSETILGTGSVRISESNGPSTGRVRGLLGVQLNIWRLKTFVQLNAMPARAASVAFGARIDI